MPLTSQQCENLVTLRLLGANVDDKVLDYERAEFCPISIYKILCDLREAPDGKTEFEAQIILEAKQTITIHDFRILPRWTEINLLPKPRKVWPDGSIFYDFGHDSRDSTTVLNHQLRRGGKLFAGDRQNGFLLGNCADPIPAEYGDAQIVPVTIQLAHRLGRQTFELRGRISRNRRKSRQRPGPREPLFSRPDPPEFAMSEPTNSIDLEEEGALEPMLK